MDANKLIELLVDDPRATVTDLADILNDTEEKTDRILCGTVYKGIEKTAPENAGDQ